LVRGPQETLEGGLRQQTTGGLSDGSDGLLGASRGLWRFMFICGLWGIFGGVFFFINSLCIVYILRANIAT